MAIMTVMKMQTSQRWTWYYYVEFNHSDALYILINRVTRKAQSNDGILRMKMIITNISPNEKPSQSNVQCSNYGVC